TALAVRLILGPAVSAYSAVAGAALFNQLAIRYGPNYLQSLRVDGAQASLSVGQRKDFRVFGRFINYSGRTIGSTVLVDALTQIIFKALGRLVPYERIASLLNRYYVVEEVIYALAGHISQELIKELAKDPARLAVLVPGSRSRDVELGRETL